MVRKICISRLLHHADKAVHEAAKLAKKRVEETDVPLVACVERRKFAVQERREKTCKECDLRALCDGE